MANFDHTGIEMIKDSIKAKIKEDKYSSTSKTFLTKMKKLFWTNWSAICAKNIKMVAEINALFLITMIRLSLKLNLLSNILASFSFTLNTVTMNVINEIFEKINPLARYLNFNLIYYFFLYFYLFYLFLIIFYFYFTQIHNKFLHCFF